MAGRTKVKGAKKEKGPRRSVRFPVFRSLSVSDYGLYPGPSDSSEGLHTNFSSGLTLVLGANGLGKTTLVWVLYRLLSGPYDIPGLDAGGDLGGRKLEPRPLRRPQKTLFAQRVNDEAQDAVAHLTFTLGKREIQVSRRLSDLELIHFAVDGKEKSTSETDSFQHEIATMAGVWSFGDWILLLRHLTFYFEDRRELVWDTSAQRQILRLLFLPPTKAKHWSEAERAILELDSRVRNLMAALFREERALAEEDTRVGSATEVREEIKILAAMQDESIARREELDENILGLDRARKDSRLTLLRAEQRREEVSRELERAKLEVLQASFPSASDTAKYLLAHILTEQTCLVCGSEAPDFAAEMEKRATGSACVICGSAVAARAAGTTSAEALQGIVDALADADDDIVRAAKSLEDHSATYRAAELEIRELEAKIAARRERTSFLVNRLPKEEADLLEQRDDLARLRSRAETLKDELTAKRESFRKLISRAQKTLVREAPSISKLFENYARDFLFEHCTLAWSPQSDRVGQSGIAIDFPAFELDLASASFQAPRRRRGPEQVSESQREFVDLSFRMALMAVADPDHGGTLVIDAPESSLDAVFVHRAAEVLARFARKRGNRLVVTSNLTEGDLIPQLLKNSPGKDWRNQVVDLFEIAEPTAAVRELRAEYTEARDRMLARLDEASA